jgi:hypothetical protein
MIVENYEKVQSRHHTNTKFHENPSTYSGVIRGGITRTYGQNNTPSLPFVMKYVKQAKKTSGICFAAKYYQNW